MADFVSTHFSTAFLFLITCTVIATGLSASYAVHDINAWKKEINSNILAGNELMARVIEQNREVAHVTWMGITFGVLGSAAMYMVLVFWMLLTSPDFIEQFLRGILQFTLVVMLTGAAVGGLSAFFLRKTAKYQRKK